MSAADPPGGATRWLYGPLPDLMLGCGLGYALIVVVFGVFGAELRRAQADWVFPLLILLASVPHYGATLVRVYERQEDRRGYRIFSVWATLLLVLCFVLGAYVPWIGSAVVTLYLVWSPWHYSGQNYGLAVMFLGRRGADAPPGSKRWLQASFVLSFLLVAVIQQQVGAADGLETDRARAIRFVALGLPRALLSAAFWLLLVGYGVSLVVACGSLLRRAPLRDLLPTLSLVLVQALWFAIPVACEGIGIASGVEPLEYGRRFYYFSWIALSHATQYLWVTSYYARKSVGWSGQLPYYAKAIAAGTAVWVLPVVLLAPDRVGRLSYDAGLALLVAGAVNLHHFILDGAIWKLRSSRIARILIRSRQAEAAGDEAAGRRLLRRGLWVLATLALAIQGLAFWMQEVAAPSALERGEYAQAAAAWDRLALLGFDSAGRRFELGLKWEPEDPVAARRQYARSVALDPSPWGYAKLGDFHLRDADGAAALAAFDAGLALDPGYPALLERKGRYWMRHGERARGLELLRRAEAEHELRGARRSRRRSPGPAAQTLPGYP